MKSSISIAAGWTLVLLAVVMLTYFTSIDTMLALLMVVGYIACVTTLSTVTGFKNHTSHLAMIWGAQPIWVRMANYPFVLILLIILASGNLHVSFWVLLVMTLVCEMQLILGRAQNEMK